MLTASRTALDETGANFLYLAIGFLEWYEHGESATNFRAPLILVPVEMNKGRYDAATDVFQYSISYLEEDIETNLSLAEKLFRDFDLALPEFESTGDPEEYFEAVATLVSREGRWRVAREMVLGLFSFAKVLMYRELEAGRWPSDRRPTDHPLIRRILGSSDASSPMSGLQLGETYEIDHDERCSQVDLVLDADSSQHSVLVDSLVDRHSLVVHGPPGTGKSQTIANLIAAALSKNMSVLFVAEKKAALEVVRTRLDECQIGDFVLELHSHRTNKGQLHRDIEKRLSRSDPSRSRLNEKIHDFHQEKNRLIAYSDAASSGTGPDEEPFYKVALRAGRFRAESFVSFPEVSLDEMPLLQRTEINGMAALVGECAQLWGELSEEARLAWPGLDLKNALGTDLDQVVAVIDELSADARRCTQVLSESGVPADTEISALRDLASSSTFLKECPPPESGEAPWPPLASDAVRIGLRNVHENRNRIPSLEMAAACLDHWPQRDDSRLLTDLSTHCDRLTEFGLGDATLPELERRLAECRDCEAAAEKLLEHAHDSTPFFGRAATYLRDFERCLEIADLFARVPLLVQQSLEISWVAEDAAARLAPVEARAKVLRSQLEERSRPFNSPEKLGADALIELASQLDATKSLWFRSTRREFRQAKPLLKTLLRNRHQLRDPRLTERIRAVAETIQDISRFSRDGEARDLIGSSFSGVDTDWETTRGALKWIQQVIRTVESPFSARPLIRDWNRTAEQVEILAGGLSPALALLRERLPSCFSSDQATAPIARLAAALRDKAELLTLAVPLFRSVQADYSTSVADIAAATSAAKERLEVVSLVESEHANLSQLRTEWRGLDTETDRLLPCVDWLQGAREAGLTNDVIRWLLSYDESPRVESLDEPVEEVSRFISKWDSAHDQLSSFGHLETEEWISEKGGLSLDGIEEACRRCLKEKDQITAWSEFSRVSDRLRSLGLGSFVALVRRAEVGPIRAVAYFKARAYEAIARQRARENSLLASFTRAGHEQVVSRFCELDKELQELAQLEIASRLVQKPIPAGIGTGPIRGLTESSLIKHELGKRRRHIPIRQLVRRAGKALQTMKPCFMMSPMSVAQYLVPGALEFDLVVMDEASQIKPEDALGAILRGRQVIVVGDPRQLPPTSFFDRVIEDEDDQEERIAAEETESILEIAQQCFPNRTLTWHYRSKHESLIAFSNVQFYDGKLILFPSPFKGSVDFGVRHHYLEGATYEARRNLREAQAVAQAVRVHLLEHPSETLGVATFNSDQRDLIVNEIERIQKSDPSFDRVLRAQEEKREPFFVKNLENVQGDEREVIFISTTYGPDPHSRVVYQRFGPISGSNGWRRLNVIFTRARRRVELFTSLRSGDIVVGDGRSRGVEALRGYLEFAETGRIPDLGRASSRGPDSDFEQDVAEVLRSHGYFADPQVGVAGFFIDVGVKDPGGSGAYVLGVECDGASYHSSKSARDRDRLRQEILKSKGWKIHRIWSTDWFKNRAPEIERLLRAVSAAVPTRDD